MPAANVRRCGMGSPERRDTDKPEQWAQVENLCYENHTG
jgi:hypothetical protein